MVERVEGAVNAGQFEDTVGEGPLLVAQATTQPAETPQPETAQRLEVAVDEGNIVRLPDGASVDQPRVNGADLEFVQADGSIIVVPNGAIEGLTIMIGAVEIPPQTVAALFAANDIQAAAGPAGGNATGSGGGNFEVPVGGIGEAFAIGGLLPPTGLAFGGTVDRPFYEGMIDSQPEAGANGLSMLDDDDLRGGNPGGLGDDASGPLTGTLVHNYGINGGTSLLLTGAALPAGLGFTSIVSENGLVLTISQDGTAVLRITLGDTTSGSYVIEQLGAIRHPGANEDNVAFEITYRVTDTDGDFIDGAMPINVDDDTPEVAVGVLPQSGESGTGGVQLVLDETFGAEAGDPDAATDDVNGAAFSSANLTGDVSQAGAKAFGQTSTIVGEGGSALAALFTSTVSLGADGGVVAHQFALSLSGASEGEGEGFSGGVQTNLVVTAVAGTMLANLGVVDRTVHLFSEADRSITGRIGGADGLIALRISLVNAQDPAAVSLVVQQLIPLVHGDIANMDEARLLSLIGGESNGPLLALTYTVTATDGDGDVATQSASVTLANTTPGGGAISFQDDGPTLTASVATEGGLKGLQSELDETTGADRANGLGETADGNTDDGNGYLGRATTTIGGAGLVSLFTVGGSFGSDGGSDVGVLSFVGFPPANDSSPGGVATNLVATVGGAITLFQTDATTIVGRAANGALVFDIKIVDGQLQTTLYQAISHTDSNLFDASATLQLLSESSSIKLQYSVTRTDGDGDTITESATVDLITREGSYFSFDDDGPVLSEVALGTGVTLDETGANFAAGPISATSAAPVITASAAFGADGAAVVGSVTYALSLTAGSATGLVTTVGSHAISLVSTGATTIQGQYDGGKVAFTVEILADGALKVTQNAALNHTQDGSTPAQHDDALNLSDLIQATVIAKDGDGDTVSSSVQVGGAITFRDDGPSVTGANATITVDEDDIDSLRSQGSSPDNGSDGNSSTEYLIPGWLGVAKTSGSLSATVNFGADGPAVGGGFSFTANALSALSGLQLQSKGEQLSYTKIGDTIIGYVDTLGLGFYLPLVSRAVFSFTLESDGDFTFRLNDQLDHVDENTNSENTALISGNGSIPAIDFGSIIQATDGDGDSVLLGGKANVTITDDIPSVSVSASKSVVVHDESAGQQADDTNSSAVRSLFNALETAEAITTPIGYAADNAAEFTFSTASGADDVKTVVVTIEIAADGTSSGLYATGGTAIYLFEENGLIVGRLAAADGSADPAGDVAFAIASYTSGGSGQIAIAQYLPIQHDPNNGRNDIETLAGKVSVKVTVTDYDGDTASQSVEIGSKIQFRDDAPKLNGNNAVRPLDDDSQPHGVADGPGDNAGGKVANGSINFTAGADGLDKIVVDSLTVNGQNGAVNPLQAIYVDANGVGTPYSVTTTWVAGVDALGNSTGYAQGGTLVGTITVPGVGVVKAFTLEVQSDGDYKLTLSAALSHPAQDNASTGAVETSFEDNLLLEFGFKVYDKDGDAAPGKLSFNVDDDSPALAGKPPATEMDEPVAPSTQTTTSTFNFTGTNGAAPNLGPNLSVNAGSVVAQFGFTDFTLQGPPVSSGAAPIVFTATPGASFTIDQLAIGVFGSPGGPGTVTLRGYDAAGNVIATATFSASAVPYAAATPGSVFDATGTVFDGVSLAKLEIVPPAGYAGRIILDNMGVTQTVVTPSAAQTGEIDLSALVNFGADGAHAAGGFQIKAFTAETFGTLQAGGEQVQVKSDGTTITGFTAGNAKVFELTIVDGKAVLTVYSQLDHGNASHLNLDFGDFIVARDGDGDRIPFGDGFVVFSVKQTNLIPAAGTASAAVDDDGLPGNNTTAAAGDIVVTPDPDNNEATFSGALPGSGGNGALVFSLAGMNNQPDTIGQEAVKYQWNSATNTLTAVINGGARNGQDLFKIVLDPATGNYTLTLLKPVMHAQGDNSEASVTAAISYTVGDSDDDTSPADTATGTLNLAFNDDIPSATGVTLSAIEGQQPLTGTLTFAPGADGAALTAINGQALTFGNGGWSQWFAGSHGALRAKANGEFEYKVQGEEPYDSDGTDAFTYTVTDRDGDTAQAVVTVNVADTIQTNFITLDNVTVNEAGSFVYTAHMTYATWVPVTITLNNGVQITFNPGQLTAQSGPQAAQGDDVYKDGTSTVVGITGISAHNFEAVDTSDTGTVTVTDTIDTVTATLTAGPAVYGATGVTIAYAIALSGAPGSVVPTNGPLTFTLTNGTVIEVPQGSPGQTVNVHYAYGSFTSPITNAIATAAGADEYEHLATAGSTSVVANTTPTVTDGTSALTVNEAALDLNQDDSDLAAGFVTGTTPASPAETAVDANTLVFHATGEAITSVVFADPAANVPTLANLAAGTPEWALSDGGRTLTLSFGGQPALILSLSGSTGAVAGADATVSVTATLTDNFAHLAPSSVLDVVLSGVTVVATDNSGDKVTGTISVNIVDDVPTVAADVDSVGAGSTISFDDVTLADGAEQPLLSAGGFIFTQTGLHNPAGGVPYSAYAPRSGANLAFFAEAEGNEETGYPGTAGDPMTISRQDGSLFRPLQMWMSSEDSSPVSVTIIAYDANNTQIGTLTVLVQPGGAGGPTLVDLSSLGNVYQLSLDAPRFFGLDDFSYALPVATGNVLTGVDVAGGDANATDGAADTLGADGGSVVGVAAGATGVAEEAADTVGVVVSGLYGQLTLNANGSYTYVRNANSKGGVDDVFTYTVKDGDGDLAQTTLTISIGDSMVTINLPTAGGAGASVHEAGLPARGSESEGSASAGNSETTAGAITYTAVDGPAVVTIGGVAVTTVGQIFNGLHGALTITSIANGSIGYSYTLADNTIGDASSDTFAIVVTDADGDAAPGNLVINIVDDVPTAVADTGALGEDAVSVSGNVLTNDVSGADSGKMVTSIGTFSGNYGTLVLNWDGSYTYTLSTDPATQAILQGLSGGQSLTDTFNYPMKDGDGDTSASALTITINGANDGVTITGLDVNGGELSVDEDDLIDGSDTAPKDSLTDTGTFTFSAVDGVGSVKIDGVTVNLGGGSQTIVDNATGTLVVTGYSFNTTTGIGTVNYSYTLKDNVAHANGGGETGVQVSFGVEVKDEDGSTANGSIDINIVDDVPTANVDTGSVTEGATLIVAAVDGVLKNDVAGADGFAASAIVGVRAGADTSNPASGSVNSEINGAYGKLTLNANGSYTYKATANAISANQVDTFTYTVRDADGDLSTTTLSINVGNVTLTATADDEVLVYEKGLNTPSYTGSDPAGGGAADTSNTLVGSVSGGTGTYTFAINGSATGNYGTLQLNPNGTYTYTLTKPYDTSPDSDNAAQTEQNKESFSYTATDGDGNTVTGTIYVDIVDDVPVAVNDASREVAEDNLAGISGNVMGNDKEGADGADLTHVSFDNGTTWVAIAALHVVAGKGTYTFEANGDWAFKPVVTVGNSDVNASFMYRLTDGDGDRVQATQPITVKHANTPFVQAENFAGLVEEEHLSGGIDDTASVGMVDTDVPGDLDRTTNVTTGNLDTMLNGGDGTITYGFNTTTGNVTLVGGGNLTSDGQPVLFGLSGGVLYGYVDNGGSGYNAGTDRAVFKVELTSSTGAFKVTLLDNIDHHAKNAADNVEGVRAINLDGVFKATDADNDTHVFTNVKVDVIDDIPVASNTGSTLEIKVDSLGISNVKAAWTNIDMTGSDDAGDYETFDRDGDGVVDEIRWPQEHDGSGYGFVDAPASALNNLVTNDAFTLGTFTHFNFPVSGDTLDTVKLQVTFTAIINGVSTVVGPITINFDHTETPNGSGNSDDIITISNSTATVSIAGQPYTLNILGFVPQNNPNGSPVTTIYTDEDASNAFLLRATFVSAAGVLQSSGDVTTGTAGADGVEVVGIAYGNASDTTATAGNFEINGQYGKLVINNDGSYTYTLTAEGADVPLGASDTFQYTIQDGDGDKSTADVKITLNVIDNVKPTVLDVTVNDTLLTESDVGPGEFVVTVKFSEAMNPGTNPTLTFGQNLAAALSLTGGVWSAGNTVFTATYAVVDTDANLSNITIDVTGAKDAAGNAQNDYTAQPEFGIDTVGPKVTIEAASDPVTGSQVVFNVVFDEIVTGFSAADISLLGSTAAGAVVTGVTGSGKNYTVTIGNMTSSGTVVASVLAGTAFDGGGNGNAASTSANNSVVFTLNKAPTDIIWNGVVPSDSSLPGSSTILANLSSADPDGNGLFTYQLLSGSSGGFAVSSTGAVTRNSSLGADTTYTLNVRVTDQHGAWHDETFTIKTGTNPQGWWDDGEDTIGGASGDDIIYGVRADDTLNGQDGNDTLFGQSGDDSLNGGAGNDFLAGGSGDDILVGGTGEDILLGGTDNDTLTGGAGVDTFKFAVSGTANADSIEDFVTGATGDIVDLSELLSGLSGNLTDNVRFEYANGATHQLNSGSAAPAQNGDVTIQVDTGSGWQKVATIQDTGGNLTAGADTIRIILDDDTGTQNFLI